MPTEEPLILHASRKGSLEQPQGPYPKTNSHTAGLDDADPPRLLQNASAIQSMLRNTTEIGNVGQFQAKQYRVPSPASGSTPKLTPRPRAGSKNFLQPLPYDHPEYYSGDGRNVPKVSRYGHSPSGHSPSRHDPTVYPHSPLSHRGPSMDEYRTYSMTQSSYITHSLTNRRPYVHGAHYYSRGPVQTFRSQSPFTYHTRLRRPGYRPSSPALSINKSVPSSDPDRGRLSRTASPASINTMNGIAAPWQQIANHPNPMPRHYPPMQRTPSSRGSTPKPTSSMRSGASSARLSQARLMFPGAWPDTPALTPPPLFYDYSEGFEEQTQIHRTSLIVITPLPKSEDDQNEYLEHSQIPESERPLELSPEPSLVNVAELSPLGRDDDPSSSETNYWPKQSDSDAKMQDHSTLTRGLSAFNPKLPESIMIEPDSIERPKSTNPNQLNTSLPAETKHEFVEQDGNPARLSDLPKSQKSISLQHKSEQGSSSPAASMYTVQSSVPLDNTGDSTIPTNGAETVAASPERGPRTPVCESSSFEFCPPRTGGHISNGSKASASVKSTRTDYPEIVAPTPERSITSLSNRDRFSKILGHDEALFEPDCLTALPSRRANKVSYVASSIPKAHPQPQESLSTTTPCDQTIAEELNSDDEGELTNGLMETFGRQSECPSIARVTKSSPKTSLSGIHEPQVPLAKRDSLGMETSPPTNVRLSHRKTVINGGQRLEAKPVTVSYPSTIAEEKASGFVKGASQLETQSINSDKDLSAIPKRSPSIKAFAPPKNVTRSDLPFAFTPLIRSPSESSALAELDATTSFYMSKHDSLKETEQWSPSDSCIDRTTSESPPDSRPWNLDASYPWEDEEPSKIEVVLPLPQTKSQHSVERPPKFKLRIHRASSSIASMLTKRHRTSEDTTSSVIASPLELMKSASFKDKSKPILSIAPSQSNSSHDVIRGNPMQTRFVESFEHTSPTSPVIALLPPSPGHDVRSFFSDDSSQARPKGSLRKRLSDFRARSSRATSVEQVPGYDRGVLNSGFGLSRASGRSSRQSQTTTGITSQVSRTRYLRQKFFRRIRAWFKCRDEQLRDRKRKSRSKNSANHDGSASL